MEQQQAATEKLDVDNFKIFSMQTYRYLFVRPWTLKEGAVVIAIIFTIMMGVTKAGWGVSFPYGIWMGKILMLLGISAEALGNFTHMAVENYSVPFFEQHMSVQNFGIITGAVIYLLTAGKFFEGITAEWDLGKRDVALYALGGICMGFGTRLANGCNVGALYTPIANFSLSGWVFLLTMIVGGIISNRMFFDCPLYSQKSQEAQQETIDA
ncbi:MAG: YeeE/YedE thiosulfate transporter family protein [Halanaerobiaceae bacterium]